MKKEKVHAETQEAKTGEEQAIADKATTPDHAACELKVQDLTTTLQRLQAEFDNYRKRLSIEQANRDRLVMANVLRKLLPVIDSFQLSLKSLNHSCQQDATNKQSAFYKGMELLYAQLYAILEEHGVRPITIQVGKEKVDPYKHEVLMTQPADLPEHTILEEFQKGYMINDEVLRTAKVKCSIAKDATEAPHDEAKTDPAH